MPAPNDSFARAAARAQAGATRARQAARTRRDVERARAAANATAARKAEAVAPLGGARDTTCLLAATAGAAGLLCYGLLALVHLALPWQLLIGWLAAWTLLGLVARWSQGRVLAGLPFPTPGLRTIAGTAPADPDVGPWVSVEVDLVLSQPGDEALRRRDLVLAVLVARANQSLDEHAHGCGVPRWTASQGTASGVASLALYTTGLLAGWVGRDVRRLARHHPVAALEVRARYTGSGFPLPTGPIGD